MKSLLMLCLFCSSAYGGHVATAVPQLAVPQQAVVQQAVTLQQQCVQMEAKTEMIEVERQRVVMRPEIITEKVQQQVTTYVPRLVTQAVNVCVPQVQLQTVCAASRVSILGCVGQRSVGVRTLGCCEERTYLQRSILNGQRAIQLMVDRGDSPRKIRIAKRALARVIRKLEDIR